MILKKQSDQNLLLVFKNSETDLQKWFDNLSKRIESLEKGSGNTCQQKLELFNEIKEDYVNNGEKLVNNLKLNCHSLKEIVSAADSQLLDDQVLKLYYVIFEYTYLLIPKIIFFIVYIDSQIFWNLYLLQINC